MRTKTMAAAGSCVALTIAAACGSGGGSTSGPGGTSPARAGGGDVTLVTSGEPGAIAGGGVVAAASRGEATFALALYAQLARSRGNVVIAPTSIATVLGMVTAGARGLTERQLRDALHVQLPGAELHAGIGGLVRTLGQRSRDGVTLSEVDQAWLQRDLRLVDEFTRTLTRDYASPLATIDFRDPEHAAAAMNAWVSDRTRTRITKLVTADSLASAKLVLTDVVYMDALWAHPFDRGRTADRPFHLTSGSTVPVPAMAETGSLAYGRGPGWKAVALPYKGGTLEMDVIVPDDAAKFERGFDATALARVLAGMQPAEITLELPKFEFRSHFDNLKGALGRLGVRDAFDPDAADLSGMTGARDLFLGTVVHEAFVHVDENGTVAAGATGGVLQPTSRPASALVRVDRPFVFLVRDKATGAVLFLGRVEDPRAG